MIAVLSFAIVALLSQAPTTVSPSVAQSVSAPTLTESEQSKIQISNLKAQLIQQTLNEADHMKADAERDKAQWEKDTTALLKEIEANHPGWSWNPADGKFTKKDSKPTPEPKNKGEDKKSGGGNSQ